MSRSLWEELRAEGAAEGLSLPWPVAGAERLGLHASTRRFYRLTAVRSGATAVMVVYPEEDGREGVARYRRTAAWCGAAGVPVPRVHEAGRRSLLVEDVGDELLAEVPRDLEARWRCYRQVGRIVTRLQEHGRRAEPPNPGWALDRRRFERELEFTEAHAVAAWGQPQRGAAARAGEFSRLAALVGDQPTAMCHRDLHARNLAVLDGRVRLLDFQDLMPGPCLYDLASLVWDNYCEVPRPIVAELLHGQCGRQRLRSWSSRPEVAVPAGPPGLPPAARQALCLVGLQRCLKALGTFGYQVAVAGRPDYLEAARRTWRYTRGLLEALGWERLAEALDGFDDALR